jgi:hypothetical protein
LNNLSYLKTSKFCIEYLTIMRLLIVLHIIRDYGCVKSVSRDVQRFKNIYGILSYILNLIADARYS